MAALPEIILVLLSMCFEKTLTKKEKQIRDHKQLQFPMAVEYKPYYHQTGFIHPTIYILKMDDPQTLHPASWGLVPEWGQRDVQAFRKKYNTLNAKCETLFTSGTYKHSAHTQRCLILADGFFEPQKQNGVSVPHFCYIPTTEFEDGRDLFYFAGLYTELDDEQYSATIITMPANDFFAEIHNVKKRQPLVLEDGLINEWFNADMDDQNLSELMVNGFTAKEFKAHAVSRDLYKRGIDTNHPGILEPTPKDTLF